jgi:hypothetical protein
MALGFAAAGASAQQGFGGLVGNQNNNQNQNLAALAEHLPCAVYNRAALQDALAGAGLDPARARKAQELEALSVAASLGLNAAGADRLVAAYQAARAGLDAECAQRMVADLTAPRGPGIARGNALQSLPDDWKAKMEMRFRDFLPAADSVRAAQALGLFRSGPRWDRMVDTIAEFNLDARQQARALLAIQVFLAEVDGLVSAPFNTNPEQEPKARLDRELAPLLTAPQASLWAARTTAPNVRGQLQFYQSAVVGVTVSGRLIAPAGGQRAQPAPQPAPTVSSRGGGAPPPSLSFLGGTRASAQILILPVEPDIIPEDERGGFGRGNGRGLAAQNNNRNPLRIEVQDNGAFQMGGIPPGRYRLVASANVDFERRLAADQYVDVRSNNVEGVNLTLRTPVEVRGQIYIAAGEKLPENFTAAALPVRLTPTAPRGNINVPTARTNSDFSFTLQDVIPAPYRVDLGGRGIAAAYLIRGAYGAVDPLKSPVTFTGGPEVLKLEVGFAAGRVDVTAMDREAPFAQATVVLVPKDRSRRDLYRLAIAGDDGKLSFETVAPGDYKVFAWRDSEVVYGDPAYPTKIEEMGQAVHVQKTGAASARVQVILEN